MVESIVPGNEVNVYAVSVVVNSATPCSIKFPGNDAPTTVEGFEIIYFYGDYAMNFLQSKALTRASSSITPYGLLISPYAPAEAYDEYPLVIPFNCCGRGGNLTITDVKITAIRNSGSTPYMMTAPLEPDIGPLPPDPEPDPDAPPIG